MTIAKYEKKFTKLTKYSISFIMDEEEKYKHFEKGLRIAIRVLVTTSMNWSNFSKLVEAVTCVGSILAEEKRSFKEKRSRTEMSEEKESVKDLIS